MPFDHGRRLDEYQGFEDLRPHSVKSDQQEPVGGKEPKSVRALPAQDNHLMSNRDKFAPVTLGFERDESEQDRNHATRRYGAARGNCGLLDVSTILQGKMGPSDLFCVTRVAVVSHQQMASSFVRSRGAVPEPRRVAFFSTPGSRLRRRG
jgi:hypothetical protein